MSKRYIDAELLAYRINYYFEHTPEKAGEHYAYSVALKEINIAPSADVEEVKHGRNLNDTPSQYECSVCGWSCWDTYTGDSDVYNYCPGCGAKMDDWGEDIPPF